MKSKLHENKELYNYCNDIITRIIDCYLQVGNITKINTTELNINLLSLII